MTLPSDPDAQDGVSEEEPDARPEGLSELQCQIFEYLRDHSWSDAMRTYDIRSKSTLEVVIMRTALGYRWVPGHPSGPLPYLNQTASDRLVSLLEKASKENNCIRTCDALELALTLKREMAMHAREALMARGFKVLAAKVPEPVELPSRSWLNSFCHSYGLSIVVGDQMDRARCLSCEHSRITCFFWKWIHVFNRDSRLIFGADETNMTPGGQFKVIAAEDRKGYTGDDEEIGHLSAMCAHGASGVSLPPFIILPKLSKLPEELDVDSISGDGIAWFTSTPKGWMNTAAFYIWSYCFLCAFCLCRGSFGTYTVSSGFILF